MARLTKAQRSELRHVRNEAFKRNNIKGAQSRHPINLSLSISDGLIVYVWKATRHDVQIKVTLSLVMLSRRLKSQTLTLNHSATLSVISWHHWVGLVTIGLCGSKHVTIIRL